MTAIVAAEARRLLSTRIWLWGLLGALASGGFAGLLALAGPENLEPPAPALGTEQGTRMLLGLLGLTAFVPAMLGTVAVTSEYRHRTISFTYLFAPRRWTVLAAKVTVFATAGAAYGVVMAACAGAGLAVAAPAGGLGLPAGAVAGLLARIVAAVAAYTVLGVAVGALLRNQVAALLVVGGYFYAAETVLLLIPGVHVVYPFLPGGAAAALTGFSYLTDAVASQTGAAASSLLPAPAGALVLLGYALVAAVLAVIVPLRRDVT